MQRIVANLSILTPIFFLIYTYLIIGIVLQVFCLCLITVRALITASTELINVNISLVCL